MNLLVQMRLKDYGLRLIATKKLVPSTPLNAFGRGGEL
jgi:hypothetical protein